MHYKSISPNLLLRYIKNFDLLTLLNYKLKKKFNLSAKIGIELEFYLQIPSPKSQSTTDIIRLLEDKFKILIKKEKGSSQFEFNFKPSESITNYANMIEKFRFEVKKFANSLGVKIIFAPKPYKNDYGNAMHINLSFKNVKNYDLYAQILCNSMNKTKKYFLQAKSEIKRLDKRFMAPTHISFGNSTNRSVMIRVLNNKHRLEHRLPSANTSPHIAIYLILRPILQYLETSEEIKNFSKIFGNAHDPQYKLETI